MHVLRKGLVVFLTLICLCFPCAHASAEEYITHVSFDIPYDALKQAMELDVSTYGEDEHVDWVELLSHLAASYYGDFSKYKSQDVSKMARLLTSADESDKPEMDGELYSYYLETYSAVLGEFLGEYRVQDDNGEWEQRYGLKAFSPIAAGFGYSHYNDFGMSRSYGYTRQHLGHDMFGSIGTPIIAVESGVVEVMGWNEYGGWRIGIRSFDGLRYHYYAHLRQNRPFHENLKEGDIVKAGDVIGYMGHTGYSTTENVNNIKQVHLHYGMQLIFDPCQKECDNEIWIDVYNLTRLLEKNRSEVYRIVETKEFYRQYDFDEDNLHSADDTEAAA